jgi:hypothetical protein
MITETVYKNRDNINSLELRSQGSAVNISGTSRMTLKFADILVDSQTHSSAFDWSTNGSNGQLDLSLGMLSSVIGVPEGAYTATLTVYDTTYTHGLVWGDFIINLK